MLLGALIIILPFMGFSSLWDMIILIVIGVLIIILAYKMKPLTVDNSVDDLKQANFKNKLELETEKKELNLPFVDHRNSRETDV